MKYKITDGLKKGYVAVLNDDGSYGDLIELADLISVSVDTTEDNGTLDAGNRTIATASAIGNTKVTVSLPALSTDLKVLIYGQAKGTDGEIIATANDNKPYLAFCFEKTVIDNTTGKEGSEYVYFYKGQFALSKEDAKTKSAGKVEFQTLSLEGTFMPLDDNNNMYMSSVCSLDEGFDPDKLKFGREIHIPTAA